MVQNYDITGFMGATLSLQFMAVDVNNNPINLTNYNVSGYVRERYSSTGILLNLQPTVDSSFVSGLINLNVDGLAIAQLPVTQAVYDIEIFNSGINFRAKVVRGLFSIMPEATY